MNDGNNFSKSGTIEYPRHRPWQPYVRSSVMAIGVMIALIGVWHLFYVFRESNLVLLTPYKSSILTLKDGDLSLITRTMQNYSNKMNVTFGEPEPPVNCVFGIVRSDGEFGNRMFLFASAYGLARLHSCHLYVHPWIVRELRSTFLVHLNETPVKLLENMAEFENRTDIFRRYSACTLFDDLFRIPLPVNYTRYELVGFYQAYGYFDRFRSEVLQLFDFNRETIRIITPFVEILIKSVWNYSIKFNANNSTVTHHTLKSFLHHPPSPLPRVTWVGVHIRRGDFLTFFRIDTSVSYLNWSMNHYRSKYSNCRFLIASDDKKYAKEHFGNMPDVFVTPTVFFHGHDLATLALSEHSILTAGTFSWWTAWLAGGNVVHDLNYPVPFQNCVKAHYFPPWFVFPHNSSSRRWTPP